MGSYDQLLHVAWFLRRAGIAFCLGGSGLLRAHGLVDANNDWDIMTDCPRGELEQALAGRRFIDQPTTGLFCSAYLVELPDFRTDIIGSFAIHAGQAVCRIPGVVSGWWNSVVPLASAEAWFVAYRLMGREDRASLLADYIRDHGVDQKAAAVVLKELLPDPVRQAAYALFGRDATHSHETKV